MDYSMILRGEGASIRIVVESRENADAEDVSDANWLSSVVDLTVGPFSGSYAGAFRAGDFVRFAAQTEELTARKRTEASFRTAEEGFDLDLRSKRTGGITVSGTARSTNIVSASLTFEFDVDASAVYAMNRELCRIVNAFPMIE
jgi:hypothetical protein